MKNYRKMSFQLSASFNCLLQMFICQFIILFYDNGAHKNVVSILRIIPLFATDV